MAKAPRAVCVTWFGERGGWPRSLVGLMIVVALACVIVADFRAWDRRTAPHAHHDVWPLISKPGYAWCRTCQVEYTTDPVAVDA